MSEKSKDERLIELMTEYLQTSNKTANQTDIKMAYPELDNEQTQALIKALRAEVNLLKEQVNTKRSINEQEQDRLATKNTSNEKVAELQSSIAVQNTQLENLENKINVLNADINQKRKQKERSAFGNWGWGLLASNILLWSLLSWFIWRHYQVGFFSNTSLFSNEKNKNNFSDVKSSLNKLQTDSLNNIVKQQDSINNKKDSTLTNAKVNEHIVDIKKATQDSFPIETATKQETAAVVNINKGVTSSNNNSTTTVPKQKSTENMAIDNATISDKQKAELTQAEIWYLRQAEERKALEESNRSDINKNIIRQDNKEADSNSLNN